MFRVTSILTKNFLILESKIVVKSEIVTAVYVHNAIRAVQFYHEFCIYLHNGHMFVAKNLSMLTQAMPYYASC